MYRVLSVFKWKCNLRTVREERQHAEMKDQPAGINRIWCVGITIMEQAMRETVPQIRTRLLQEDVLDVCGERLAKNGIQFTAHLFV